MYYDEKGLKGPQFEQLTAEEQTPYLDRVAKIIGYMDKLNLVFSKRVDTKKLELTDNEKFNKAQGLVREFIGKLKHPKHIGSFFPVDELARKIVEVM